MNDEFNEMTYDKLYARLEEIVNGLESGDLSLEESIARYEKGMGLYRECCKRLKEAEEKVTQIGRDEEGGTKLESFQLENGEQT